MPLLRQLPIKLGVENHNVHRVDQWIDSLMLKGIRNFEDLVMCDRLLELSRECRVPFEVLNFWIKWIKFNYSVSPVSLFDETRRVEEHQLFHSFGCTKFDEFLGGIPSGNITQISGDEACGKTQLCHSLAVEGAMKNHHVMYIDTESTLSGERMVNMMKTGAAKVPIRELCDRIEVAKVFSVSQLFQILHGLGRSKTEKQSKTAILIIDSMLGVLIPLVVQLDLMGEKQQQTMIVREFAKVLRSLVISHPDLAIVVTTGNLKWFTKNWNNVPNLKLHLSLESVTTEEKEEKVGEKEEKVVRKIEVQRSFKCDSPKFFNFTIENGGCRDYTK